MLPKDPLRRPTEWDVSSIAQEIEIKRGVSWSKEQEQLQPSDFTVPVVGISNVQKRFDTRSLVYLTGVPSDVRQEKQASAGWTLVVGSNGNRKRVGNAAYIDVDQEFLFGSFLLGLKPRDKTRLRPDFFYRWLTSETIQGVLSASAEGSTGLNNLSHSFLRSLFVPVPAPEEQAAIARILNSVDTAIERTQQVVAALVDLEYSLLHELLGQGQDPPGTKVGEAVKTSKRQLVDEVAEVGSGVTLGKDVSGVRYAELPYLRVANVQDGHLDLGTIKTVRVSVRDVDRYRLQAGDVLMTEGGDIDKLGRGTIWQGQIEDCLHQNHIFRVRADLDKLEPRYFAWVVHSNIAKAYFLRVAKRTTNLASINKTQLRAFRFPVPELGDQRFIADTMEAARATTEAHNAKMAALVDLKRSLTHDLLTGKVRTHRLKLDGVAA